MNTEEQIRQKNVNYNKLQKLQRDAYNTRNKAFSLSTTWNVNNLII